jgi:hypothetical protein
MCGTRTFRLDVRLGIPMAAVSIAPALTRRIFSSDDLREVPGESALYEESEDIGFFPGLGIDSSGAPGNLDW